MFVPYFVKVLLHSYSYSDKIIIISAFQRETKTRPCMWNGNQRSCYLFARKFLPETLDNLLQLFPNYTSIE